MITPGDIITAHPEIWPFSQNFASYYASHARPLKNPIANLETKDLSIALKVDAIFIFNDPRDWALDTQLILDLLLSHQGYLGTVSDLISDESLPNYGYQQDGQPLLFFSNPDLHWAAAYHLPRLGQGGFREAFEGVWRAVTSGKKGNEAILEKCMYGKPNTVTYAYAEKKLELHRGQLLGAEGTQEKLKKVYMVGGTLVANDLRAQTKGLSDNVNADLCYKTTLRVTFEGQRPFEACKRQNGGPFSSKVEYTPSETQLWNRTRSLRTSGTPFSGDFQTPNGFRRHSLEPDNVVQEYGLLSQSALSSVVAANERNMCLMIKSAMRSRFQMICWLPTASSRKLPKHNDCLFKVLERTRVLVPASASHMACL